jgi:PAS domain S-box-containing protein
MSAFNEQLEEHAALYAAGALTERERVQFELILKFHDELREFVKHLEEAAAGSPFTREHSGAALCPTLKSRVLEKVHGRLQRAAEEGFVLATPDGLVEWVNPAFVGMCGYTLEELKGRKLGPLLQGELTDPAVAARIRKAVAERQPCTEALINYHKDGTPYWVSLNITPIWDDAGHFLCFIARELELPERTISCGQRSCA